MPVSKSYKKCSCQDDCYALGMHEDEPCWGNVNAIDEVQEWIDWDWVHACQGHKAKYDGGDYKKEVQHE